MKRFLCLMICALAGVWLGSQFSSAAPRQSDISRNVKTLREVKTIYVQKISGDQVFASRLKNEIRQMGLRFVKTKSQADAIFSASGDYENGAFYGQMKFFNRRGKLLWQAKATRPRGNNYMAYSRLADQLRRALGK